MASEIWSHDRRAEFIPLQGGRGLRPQMGNEYRRYQEETRALVPLIV
jgi:hypothetical protein